MKIVNRRSHARPFRPIQWLEDSYGFRALVGVVIGVQLHAHAHAWPWWVVALIGVTAGAYYRWFLKLKGEQRYEHGFKAGQAGRARAEKDAYERGKQHGFMDGATAGAQLRVVLDDQGYTMISRPPDSATD